MDEYPEDYELLGFFETEPTSTDRDVPREYNRNTYNYHRDDNSVICAIDPGYGQIDLTWRLKGEELASFALRDIRSIEIDGAPGDESMTVRFLSDELSEFVLFLKPRVRIEWSNPSRTIL